MEKLFGLEMAAIAGTLSTILALVMVSLALLAWRRPVFLKLGLRPIPRRRAQSTLIVLGLMLATLIITAAFVTGDTLSHSIRSVAIEGMGEIDEVVQASGRGVRTPYFRMARYEELAAELAGYPLVDRILPAILESAPVVNVTSRSSLRSIDLMGLRPQDISVLPEGEITDAAGQPLLLEALDEKEVYLNAAAAEALSAAPGDMLEFYVSAHPKYFTVRGIAGMGEEPRMLVTLRQAQRAVNQTGRIKTIVVSNLGDELEGAAHSQEVTARLRGLLSDPKAAARVYATLSRDPAVAEALRKAAKREQGNTQADLLALADGMEAGELSLETRSLLADAGLASRVQSILSDAEWGSEPQRERLARYFDDLSELVVEDIKRDTLDMGDMAASAFTTIFVVSGLFGITAGMVLIFLIFVMLAAERKSEMGMARAVGAQRGRLVEMFVFEGTLYAFAASAVGALLGLLFGRILIYAFGFIFSEAFGDVAFPFYFTWDSVIMAFCIGLLLTFLTIFIASRRISKLSKVFFPSHLRHFWGLHLASFSKPHFVHLKVAMVFLLSHSFHQPLFTWASLSAVASFLIL